MMQSQPAGRTDQFFHKADTQPKGDLLQKTERTGLPDPPYKCKFHVLNEKDPHTHVPLVGPKNIYENITEVIGNTPLVRLTKIPQQEGVKCDLLAKCEFLNPSGSAYDRVGFRMIRDAEKSGKIRPGDTLVVPTCGNTGISIAMVANLLGYKCIFVMPRNVSLEKEDMIRGMGFQVIRRPDWVPEQDEQGFIGFARKLASMPGFFLMDQYSNPSNSLAHYDQTAEEIMHQCDGSIDFVFISAGTGGTITGIGRKFKEKMPNCKIVAVDPEGSLQAVPDKLNCPQHETKMEGPGNDFIPLSLDRRVVDFWVKHSDKDAFEYARRLIREEGLLVGASSGAVLASAIKFIKEQNVPLHSRCVLIFQDLMRNYLSKFASDQWMIANHFMPLSTLKTESSLLSGIPLNKENLRLKPLKLVDEKLTLGQALASLEEGMCCLPLLKNGEVFRIIRARDVIEALSSGAGYVNDLAINYGTEDFTIFDMSIGLDELEILLRKLPFVLLQEKNGQKVVRVYVVTPMNLISELKKKVKV